ncbi:MAG: S9 family peptidase [Chitinophagaceae bacterium]|nr:MAG: S9 family peptidase [Chitinophagaceae bacterium]
MQKQPVTFFLAFLFFGLLAANAQRTLRPGDIYNLKSVRSPSISPDGKWVVYAISTTDSAKDRASSDLWMTSWDGKETIQLTSSADSESDPQWSPDGKYISFVSSRESGKSQLWLLDRRGGEGIKLTDEKRGVNSYLWSPDSKKILLLETDLPDTAMGKRTPYVISRYQFKRDVQGYSYDVRNTHLYLFDLALKKSDTLTTGSFNESDPQWSPDGKNIVFVSNRTDDPDRNRNTDLWMIEARKNSPVKQLTTWAGGDSNPKWSDDGQSIAYMRTSTDAIAEAYEQRILCVIPVTGGEPLQLSAALDRPVASFAWAKDSRSIGVLVQDDARSYLGVYELKKNTLKKIAAGDRSYLGLDANPAGGWLVSASEPSAPAELFTVRNDQLQRITSVNKAFADSIQFGTVEKYTSTSRDGTLVSGTLIFPPGKSRTNLPLLMNIHGGPVSQNEIGFDLSGQMLAAKGYLVATVNYRGSSGRGLEFSHSISGDWGNLEVIDILGANDQLVKSGLVDSTKMGILGWSYGGILTDYVIASTTRFKAASSGAGVAAPLSLYGVDQYISQYDNELGKPWEKNNIERYIKLSYPLLHADRISTPTQFMGGEKDFNVPIAGSEQMYQALRSLNIPTQLVVYPGQFHGLTQPSFIKDRFERYISWFGKYIPQ